MSVNWSESELELLKEYYPKGGYFLCKEKGLKRKRDATLKKAQSINLKVEGYNHLKELKRNIWQEWELELLKNNYPSLGKYGLVDLLPDRTESAIVLKANSLGLHKKDFNLSNSWDEEEIKLLYTYYPLEGVGGCKKRGLNRSECSIVKKAEKEGLKMVQEAKIQLFHTKVRGVRTKFLPWTQEELDILEKYFKTKGANYCKKQGIKRELSSIYRKAREKGYKHEK